MVGALGCDDAREPASSDLSAVSDSFRGAASEFHTRPPAVDAVDLTLLAAGSDHNARLEVRFTEGQEIGPTLLVELDDGEPIVLRDDGDEGDLEADDGTHSAIVSFDLGAAVERRLGYLERVAPDSTTTHFRGRNAEQTVAFEASALDFVFDGEPRSPETIEPEVLVGATLAMPTAAPTLAVTTDFEKTLVVRDLQVVQDPTRTGVWALNGGSCKFSGDAYGSHGFSRLMQEMAAPAGVTTEAWVQDWLRTYATGQTVNGETAPSNSLGLEQVWNRFRMLADDGDPGQFNDTLDLSAPPFQLLAIVNRVDLHEAGVFGGNAGELRYVFGLVDIDTCEPMKTSLIFEYAVPDAGCRAIKRYASKWYALDAMSLGSPAYNAALEAITDPVVRGGANPNHATGSALAQLRVNSQTLFWPHYPVNQWHMREYENGGGGLHMRPVAMTPSYLYENPDWANSEQPIDDFINTYAASIVAGSYTVGLHYPGTNQPFQAAYAPYGYVPSSTPSPYTGVTYFDPFVSVSSSVPAWAVAGGISGSMERARYWGSHHAAPAARHEFSLNTCSGCHGRETFDDGGTLYQNNITYGLSRSVAGAPVEEPFLHIRPQNPVDAGPAHLSRFMTGTDDGCTTPTGLVAPLGTETCTASCCPIGDPANGPSVGQYHYDDLERRGEELESIVTMSCIPMISAAPIHLQLTPAH